MTRYQKVAISCLVALGLAAPSAAATITINFDADPAPTGFLNTTALTTQLSAFGVSWDGGGAILDQDSNFGVSGHSPQNFLAYNSLAIFQNGDPVQHTDTLFISGPASQVSFDVGSGNRGMIFFATAFDSSNAIVDAVAGVNLASALQTITLSGPGIARVEYGLSQGQVFVLDNLVLSDASVPEPGVLTLLAGAVAAARLRRRRRDR